MIKFFRKIRQNLLAESRFSNYMLYAIGEIILVVIGILIALQVNEWNKERNRTIAEQTIITQLQADLKKSQLELQEIKDFYLARARVSAQMTRAFWKTELPDNIERYVTNALASRVYSPVSGTARSLINSGKIDIISSTELKNEIISYVEKVDYLLRDVSRYEETYYRKGVDLVREVMPNALSLRSKEEVNKIKKENLRGFEQNVNEFDTPIDKVPFEPDLSDMLKDARFYRGYSYLLLAHRNIGWRYDDILEATNELFSKLNKASTNSELVVNNTNHYLIFDTLDLKILQKADAILSDSSKWNKNDNRKCDDDIANDRYSLYCALSKARLETIGKYERGKPALKIVEFTIKKYEQRRVVENPLSEWNNHPDTTFEELKKVLKESMDEVKKQL
jgi:hypothetical protein